VLKREVRSTKDTKAHYRQREKDIIENYYLEEVKFETKLVQQLLNVGKRQELGEGFLKPNNA
jgi:hypothetical protein